MRVVLADHDPAVLAASARALQGLIDCVQVTSKQDCLARLREGGCDIVVACERLADGSGLDLLATIGMSHPELLRIFAADAERLKKLGAHLTPFKLFDTIGYPLDSMQLRSAMALAIAERGDLMSGEFENIVLGEDAPPDDEVHPDPIESHPQIVVLTRDSTALEGANAALADKPYRVITARDADEARADLVARQPVLALVDVGTLGMDPVNWFAEAHRASPATLLLALGRRNDGLALESLVSSGVVNRFVAKPVSHAGMRLVLDSALRLQAINGDRGSPVTRLPEPAPPPPPPPPPAALPVRPIDHEDALAGPIASLGGHALTTVDWQPPGAPAASRIRTARAPRPDRHPGRLPLPVALAAAAVLAFGAAWFYFSHDGDAGPAAPATASTPAAATATTSTATPGASTPASPSAQSSPQPTASPVVTSTSPKPAPAPGSAPGNALATDPPAAVSATTSIAPGVTLAPPEPDLPVDSPADATPPPATDAPASALEPSRPAASPTDLRPSKLTSVSFAGKTVEDSTQPVVPAPVPPSRAMPSDRPPPVVMEMKLLRGESPFYPEDARRRRIEGSVELAYIVGSDGKVRDVHVTESTPPGVFDDEAISAVRRWRYDPRREDGVPVDYPAKVRLAFQLED